MVLVLVGVVVLAYFASRWLSKRYAGQGQGRGQTTKYLTVLERLPVGQDRTLIIVKVGEKAMLLGVTQHHIEKLSDVDLSTMPEPSASDTPSFSDAFKAALKSNLGLKSPKKSSDKEEKQNLDDI